MNRLLFTLLLICVFFILSGCNKDESCINCPPTQLDTTSHLIQWQPPDTLGAQGIIRDVWVFDRNNAWAVGEIYLNDSTGKPDMENPYNCAHWDGVMWAYEKIPTAIFGNSENVHAEIYTIYSFGESDIWTFSITGSYSHWDGVEWTTNYVSERSGGGNELWGLSSINLFLVGTNGSNTHYNGTSWTKMTSNTTVDLQDIWGIDANHIWATGTNTSDGHCVVLQFNGTNWTTIYDNENKPINQIQYFKTLWTDNKDYLILDGGSYTNILNLQNGSFTRIDSISTYEVFCLRGVNRNDIFHVGYGSEVTHYNGVNWYLYNEFKALNVGNAWFTGVYPTRDMIVIGGLFLTDLNGFPIVIRGYR
ncbi:MAG: hypothetical protein JXA06_01700 [Bacteroidetes bacterium]|nr:hypothetical protein [Bacteroidota bacterium]